MDAPHDKEHALKLRSQVEENCQKAAVALNEADVVLLVTGAGWGADSGLAVYADIAQVKAYKDRNLEYRDICQPHWLDEDPGLFYGFWGQCLKDYRTARPHEGYEIVQLWRDRVNTKKAGRSARNIRRRTQAMVNKQRPFDDDDVQHHTPYDILPTDEESNRWAGAFFSFTSNVDAHFHDFLHAQEIHECHGNLELWQCSDPYCFDPQPSLIWRMPKHFEFAIDKESMLAPPRKSELAKKEKDGESSTHSKHHQSVKGESSVPHIGQTTTRSNLLQYMPPARNTTELSFMDDNDNYPKCPCCGNLARPNILMFGDLDYKRDYSQKIRWQLWSKSVQNLAASRSACEKSTSKKKPLRICLVEVGAGTRVPTARRNSEAFIDTMSDLSNVETTLVRINPDFPLAQGVPEDCLIPIMANGLRAVQLIEQHYSLLIENKQQSSNKV